MKEPEYTEDGVRIIDITDIMIPECCREGWDSCPHVVNRETKRDKRNIGL